jgi:outer membrane protein OmpA-like peptidoglycan-associated protein
MRRHAIARRLRRSSEPWQVIYTDLMTIVMVFFVILWSIHQAEDVGVSETVGDTTVKRVDLPGDVLFASGKATMTDDGKEVFEALFKDDADVVLNFDAGDLVKRLLVIHGHTDADGDKRMNLRLGFARALAAYDEIQQYSDEVADHAVICTHADNTAAVAVPAFDGRLTAEQREAVDVAKARNRRITIEDKLVSQVTEDGAL